MRKYLKFTSLITFIALLLISCSINSKNIKGDKHITTKEFPISDYTQILLNDQCDIVYQQKDTDTPYLQIEIDKNLVDYINVKVENKQLSIEVEKGVSINPSKFIIYTNSKKLVKVNLTGAGDFSVPNKMTTDSLNIKLSGTGDIEFENLECKFIDCYISGAGDVELQGSASFAKYYISGAGDIDAEDFVVDSADCKVTGVGNIEIYATEKLTAKVSGVGSIKYKGNPKIEKSVSGVGSVKQID